MARLEIDLQVKGFKGVASQVGQVDNALGRLQSSSNVVSKNIQTLTNSSTQLEGRLSALRSQFASGAISQSQYEKSSKGLGIAIENVRGRIGQLQAQQRSLTATLSQASTAAAQQGSSLKRLSGYHESFSSGVRSSNTIAVEFSRIIQDAPYGIQGVANNIQQLTQNYSYYAQSLRKAAAEQGKSISGFQILRGAVSSFVSPLNLLTIGISLATAGFIAYEKWSQRSAKATKEAEKSITDYIDKLSGLKRAQADGIVNSQKEIAVADQLYKATQNTALSIDVRRKAGNDLVKKYPAYFKGLNTEQVLAGKGAEAYDKLARNITATAMAQAYLQKITDNATKSLNSTLEALEKGNELARIRQQIAKQEAITSAGQSVGAGSEAAESGAVRRLNGLYEQERALRNDISNLNKTNSDVTRENQSLQGAINAQLEKGASLTGDIGGGLDKVNNALSDQKNILDEVFGTQGDYYSDQIFKINEAYNKLVKDIQSSPGTSAQISDALGIAKATRDTELLVNSFEKLFNITKDLSQNNVSPSGSLSGSVSLPGLSQNQERFSRGGISDLGQGDKKQEERIAKVVERGLRSGFSDIFNSIDDLGSNFFEVFSNVFSKLASTVSNTFGQVLTTQLGSVINSRLSQEDFEVFGLGSDAAKYTSAGAGLLGGILSQQGSRKNNAALTIGGGALSGAAAGLAFGPYGAAVGAVVGAISGIFQSAGARKQEKIQEAQLAEQRKQTALQERQAALSFTTSITGRMSNQGIVTGTDINEFGEVTFRIQGKDLVASLNRENNSR